MSTWLLSDTLGVPAFLVTVGVRESWLAALMRQGSASLGEGAASVKGWLVVRDSAGLQHVRTARTHSAQSGVNDHCRGCLHLFLDSCSMGSWRDRVLCLALLKILLEFG